MWINEVIFEVALRLSTIDLYNFCRINKHFNLLLRSNEYFWQCKYLRDFGQTSSTGTWKECYRNRMFGDIYLTGITRISSTDYEEYHNLTLIPNLRAKSVHAGDAHGAIVGPKGELWTFGNNSYGQLGFSENDLGYHPIPRLISGIKVRSVALGSSHTVLLDLKGGVWTFGNNFYGQLGVPGLNSNLYEPTCVLESGCKAIATGYNHTLVIDSEDKVWAFGKNTYGQLGVGDITRRMVPTQLPGPLYAKAIAGAHEHSVILSLDGTVWTSGWNYFGQLGVKEYIHEITRGAVRPVQIPKIKGKMITAGGNRTIVVSETGTIWIFGDITGKISDLKVREISTSFNHTLIITTDGTVWVFGENDLGQLGVDPFIMQTVKWFKPIPIPNLKARSVSAGFNFSLIAGWKIDPNR